MTSGPGPLWAVLPGGVDDPAAPSGGNRYDRAVLSLLPDVHEIAVPGSWPQPGPDARRALSTGLAEIPDKSDVLIDGLVGCGVPEILEPHAGRLRLMIVVHLPLSDETGLSPGVAADLRERERRALHLATVVIATSDAAAERVAALHGLPRPAAEHGSLPAAEHGSLPAAEHGPLPAAEHGPLPAAAAPHGTPRIAVAAPGVEPAELAEPRADGRRLLCVASVSPRKGQDLLVAALEEDLSSLDWECTYAGALVHPVPHRNHRTRFVGALPPAALDRAYGKSDLLILPSRAETYGMVVTEALARGLPVIATAVGGVPEALGAAPDGTLPGILIPPDDRPALTAAIRRWLTDDALRQRLRAAARARRETLPTWAGTARQLSAIRLGDPR
ncbi:glycosyltransferase family 4 protein [Actinoplanes sp. Pm04-4]|uniref:Glycosyltransferase family 4 protein n=1 Tax=Paractinoplanes pyxinae TaxID=2997416 RepID=A0ABT4B128_9ACTN|nr:glycosyltransferase family 4 protein [Actinoplanes pyxinae]MCY1139600.1 glycosyltransferase family 4 protein [Actinoplanes pyxinae]